MHFWHLLKWWWHEKLSATLVLYTNCSSMKNFIWTIQYFPIPPIWDWKKVGHVYADPHFTWFHFVQIKLKNNLMEINYTQSSTKDTKINLRTTTFTKCKNNMKVAATDKDAKWHRFLMWKNHPWWREKPRDDSKPPILKTSAMNNEIHKFLSRQY